MTDHAIPFGGFNPSQAQYLLRMQDARNRTATHAQIIQQDPRAQFLAGIWNQNMGQSGAPSNRQLLMAGTLANSQALSGLFGGSRLDMYSGIHSGLQNMGGMRFGGELVRGAGNVTGITAQALMNQMESQMFSNTGGARLHRTGGLDRGQLGRVAAYVGASGGFGDLGNMGTMHTVTRANRAQLMDRARAQGDMGFVRDLEAIPDSALAGNRGVQALQLSQEARARFNSTMQEYAQVVGSIRDIMGDIGDNHLFRALEDLAGFSGVGAAGAAQSRLGRIRQMSTASGAPAEGLIATFTQLSQAGRAMGFGSQHAATMAERSLSAQAARRHDDIRARGMFAARGIHLQDMSEAGHRQRLLQQSFMQTEMPELSTMLYAVQTAPNLSGGQRANLMAQIQAAGQGPGGSSERRARLMSMQGAVEKATGASMGFWFRHADGDTLGRLGSRAQDVFGAVSASEANARNLNRLGTDLRTAFGGDVGRARDMVDLARNYSAASIIEMADRVGGQRGRDMQFTALTLSQSEYGQGIVSREQMETQARLELAALNVENALGTQPASRSSLLDGLLGGTAIGDQQVISYLQTGGKDGQAIAQGREVDLSGRSVQDRLAHLREAQARGYGIQHIDGGRYMVYEPEDMRRGMSGLEAAHLQNVAKTLGVTGAKSAAEAFQTGLTHKNLAQLGAFGDGGLDKFMSLAQGDEMGRRMLITALDTELKNEKYKEEGNAAQRQKLEEARDTLRDQEPFDMNYAFQRIVGLLSQIVKGDSR
jgi:hypothetical protein